MGEIEPHPLQIGETFDLNDLLFWLALITAVTGAVTSVGILVQRYYGARD